MEFCYEVATDLCQNGISCVVNGIETLCQTTSYLPSLYSYSDLKISDVYHYDIQRLEYFTGCQSYLPLNLSNICDLSSYFKNPLVWCYQRSLSLCNNGWDSFGYARYTYEHSFTLYENDTKVRCGDAFPDYCHLANISNCYYEAQNQLNLLNQGNEPWWDTKRKLLFASMLIAFVLIIASAAFLLLQSIRTRPQHKFFKLPREEQFPIQELQIKIDKTTTINHVLEQLEDGKHNIHTNVKQQNEAIRKSYIQKRIQRPDEIAAKQAAIVGLLSLWAPSTQNGSLAPELTTMVAEYLTRREANNVIKSCRLANNMAKNAKQDYNDKHPELEAIPLLEEHYRPSAKTLKIV